MSLLVDLSRQVFALTKQLLFIMKEWQTMTRKIADLEARLDELEKKKQ